MFGLNIVQQQRDRGALGPFLARLKPAWVLVQDEHKLARELRLAGYNVIFRAWRNNDAALHQTMQPAQFVNEMRASAENGIVIQCLNEPLVQTFDEAQALARWCAEAARAATAAGVRLCLPNFAMGNPDEKLIASGAFDPLLGALAGGRHLLGLHEYAKRGDLAEGWLIGRYRHWLKRAQTLGAPRPEIVVTECGWDIGGGGGDGWHEHISPEQYADLLRSMGQVYRADGVAACVFCWGDGFGWQSFSIAGVGSVMDALAQVNAVEQPRWEQRRIVLTGGWCNIRAEPTTESAATRFERNKTIVEYAPNRDVVDEGGALLWQMVRIDGRVGWVRNDAAQLKPVETTSPPPPASGGVFVSLPDAAFGSREEALRLADALEGYARAIRAQVNR